MESPAIEVKMKCKQCGAETAHMVLRKNTEEQRLQVSVCRACGHVAELRLKVPRAGYFIKAGVGEIAHDWEVFLGLFPKHAPMALSWLAERVLPLYESALNAWLEDQDELNRTLAAMRMPWPADFRFDPDVKCALWESFLRRALVEVGEWVQLFHLLDNNGHVPLYLIEQLQSTLPYWSDPAWKRCCAGRNWGPLEGGLYEDEPPTREAIQEQLAKARGRHKRMDAVDLKALGREPYRQPSAQSLENFEWAVEFQVAGIRKSELAKKYSHEERVVRNAVKKVLSRLGLKPRLEGAGRKSRNS